MSTKVLSDTPIDVSGSISTALANWSTDGRSQFTELYKQLLDDKLEAELAVKRLLVSLCKSCLQGSQSVETVVRTFSELQEILLDPSTVGTLLADVFATLDIELFPSDETKKETYKERFFQLIHSSEHIVTPSSLMERLEIETLEYLDLIVNRDQFNQKYVRIKTRLFYKQQKFNLLREESEGFAKAITELYQDFPITKLTAEQLYDRLMALIGYFDIDPNRMLDLVLEAFECRPQSTKIYVDLLRLLHFDQTTLCQLIGFKFQTYQLQDDTPESLYLLAAQLVSHKLIDLDDLLPHLYPLVTDFSDNYTKDIENARTAKKGLTSLVDSTGATNKSKESITIKSNNQLLHFIHALLIVGDLEDTLVLFNYLPHWSCTTYREINVLLSEILGFIIDPFYKSRCELHSCFLQYQLVNPLQGHVLARELPIVTTIEDFRRTPLPLLLHLGSYCQDRLLFMKLIRLCTNLYGKSSGIQSEEADNVLLIIDEVLLPSLSLLDVNGCLAIELWSLIKLLPYDVRYRLYGQWHEDTYRKTSQLIFVKQEIADKTRAVLRRINKVNVKTYSRQIAKMTHNNPTVILSVIIDQVQRFDNFIVVIIDTMKYLSPLAYDVVCYIILRALTTPAPSTASSANIDGKMSRENATPAAWFQNLCVLSANAFKKYPIDFTSILYYIYDQLRAEKSYDLYLLREIITKMSGLEISSAITREQLEAAAGGELLRNEAGQFTAARNVKKPSIRLKEALMDRNLYLPLAILIAQQRSCIVFKFGAQRSEHLKLTGSLYDQCQDTMVQFFTFLSNVLTSDNFHETFPSINDLVLGFHLQVDAAFQMSRPLFNLNIQAKLDELRSTLPKPTSKTALTQKYIEAVTTVMSPVLDFVKTLHPQRTWEEMTPQFYLTFWSLSMSDLHVPEPAYKRRIVALELEMNQTDERKDLTTAKKRKEKEKVLIIIDKLNEELIKQNEHVERVRARLDLEREHWFKNRNKTKAETITEFLQLCIFPRCLLSEIDALYCAHFIRVIHDLVTPNFSTIICYDRLFSDISYSLASCSENEAVRYGRFLLSLLETVMSWHSDKNKFDKECATHPGFLTVFRNAVNAASKLASGSTQSPEQLDYDNFRHVCHKWHYKLAKSFIVCLDSNDYIQIRNVLQVLTVLLPIYPKMTTFYAALERRIKAICVAEKDRRHDLFALAKCYSGRLANKHRDMIDESQFHLVPERPTVTATAAAAANNSPTGTISTTVVPATIAGDASTAPPPILPDAQQTPSARPTATNANSSGAAARSTSDKPVHAAVVPNGSTTTQKSASPAPTSQPTALPPSPASTTTTVAAATTSTSPTVRVGTLLSTDRTINKVKGEPVISNNPNTTAKVSSSSSSKAPHGPALPSSLPTSSAKSSGTTTVVKNDVADTPPSTTGPLRTIKMSSNGADRPESLQMTTTAPANTNRESPPTVKQSSSTAGESRRHVLTTPEQQSSSSSKPVAPPVARIAPSTLRTFSSSRNTSAAGVNADDSSRRPDLSVTNGANISTATTLKNQRTESPHELVPAEKRVRGSSSKGDRSAAAHREEPRNGSRSGHRDHKHESNKRTRSTTPEKGPSNGSGSQRRLNQTAESTLVTTPIHQETEHVSVTNTIDVSPSSKRIKTSEASVNGRQKHKVKEARGEDRHTSSHRVASSSRSGREKYHSSKESK